MNTALVLFAHGARDPAWADPMRRVQSTIRQMCPELPVELAFLEFMAPNLSECLAGLLADGVKRVVIVPMFIARGGHLKHDLPQMIEALRSTYPDVQFCLCGAIGEQEAVIQAMAVTALREAGL